MEVSRESASDAPGGFRARMRQLAFFGGTPLPTGYRNVAFVAMHG